MGVEVMGIVTWFQESVLSNTLMMVFLIAVIGYLVGSIKICGLELGPPAFCWWPWSSATLG